LQDFLFVLFILQYSSFIIHYETGFSLMNDEY